MTLGEILAITRPLVVLDVETTGTTGQDRILQIAATKHYPDARPAVHWATYVNPEIPVPETSRAVHGITDEMLKDAPTFEMLAEKLIRSVLTGVDFAGHNVGFDLKMIRSECNRVAQPWDWERSDSCVIDTLRIYQIKDPRDLASAHWRFVKQVLADGHDAGRDVQATERVLLGQLAEFEDLPRNVAALAEFCQPKRSDSVDRSGKIVWRDGVACIGFGKKWNGVALSKVDRGYFQWMLNNDFPLDTQDIVRHALLGVFPVKAAE